MIPRANVTAWRFYAPWPTDAQIEQDLVLSRALVELFRNSLVAETTAFRGGTALHKLFIPAGMMGYRLWARGEDLGLGWRGFH